MWIDSESDPRTYGNPQGEKATYQEYLTNYRLTLGMKCDGLSPEQLATAVGAAEQHEPAGAGSAHGCGRAQLVPAGAQATGEERLYRTADDRDHDFNAASATRIRGRRVPTWRREIAKADEWFASVPEADLGRELPMPGGDDVVSIRDVVVHMIEEYARHCGHADLLRECIDGRTGQ